MTSTALVPKGNVSLEEPNPPPFVWDALPYIDVVNEPYEQYALSLIEGEMKAMNHPSSGYSRPRLPPIPEPKLRTEMLHMAYQNFAEGTGKGKPSSTMDQEPVSLTEPSEDTVEAWSLAVQRARIAYEKERIRSLQLEVERDETVPSAASGRWKRYHAQVLEPQLTALQQEQEQEQLQVAMINQERQQSQRDEYQPAMYRWHGQYQDLLQKQFLLKQAIANLEVEINGGT
jgi:Breast carcinoma amplified sequence 2 (BCAS2)